MADLINEDTFNHLVELAALELNENEAVYLCSELNNQLKAIEELAAIPLTAETAITSHGITYTAEISMPVRQDEWIPYPDPGQIIAQAPESEDGYIIVPDIPHQELE